VQPPWGGRAARSIRISPIRALERYLPLVRDTEITDLVAALWASREVWFMYEQVFAKTGGVTRRTPWHQDAPYLPVRGEHLAVVWMSFETVEAERDRWPIVSWGTAPGDAVVAARPGTRPAEPPPRSGGADEHPLTRMRRLRDGVPFRDPAFPQLRP
jgi:hypothetical protein